MTTYSIQAPDGKTYTIDGPSGANDDQVRAEVLKQHPDADKPAKMGQAKEERGPVGKAADIVGGFLEGYGQAGNKLVSGAVAPIAGGLAGLAQGAANIVHPTPGQTSAADRVEQVEEALTYRPTSKGANRYVDTITKPLQMLGEGADVAGGATARGVTRGAEALGVPAETAQKIGAGAGATVNTGIQMLPAVIDPALRAAKARIAPTVPRGTPLTAEAAAPAAKAAAYAQSLGLDWGKLSDAFKGKLTELAKTARGFEGLKPEAVKRQALFSEAGIENPTRGQVTRDTEQRQTEAAVKQTGAGKELRDLDEEHNRVLLKGVEDLRTKVAGENIKVGAGKPGEGTPAAGRSQARGDLPVGRSVQDTALRAKAEAAKKNYERLYKKARETDPEATVAADPMYELLQKNPHIQHLGWMDSWLKRAKIEQVTTQDGIEVRERRGITLNELHDLRHDANEISRAGGTDAHYAAQVREAIDKAMEEVPEGAKAWKEANSAFRKYKEEFANQGAVRGLVEDKPHTTDRRVAIEDTARKTVTGKLEDLQKVKRSLLTGPDAASRAAGKTAWRDLKGWGLDYIRQRMTKGPVNAAGDPHTTWVGLKTALDDIGDENLDELYGRTARQQLRRYAEAAENLWTEPSTRIVGSPTFEKILRFLDRIGGVPVLGHAADVVSGGLKTGAKLSEIGKTGRETRTATTTPVDEQLSTARRQVKQSQRRQTYRAGVGPGAAAEEQSQ